MKKIITAALILAAFASCKKEATATKCYECNFTGRAYYDAGCMTPEQWAKVNFTDANGNNYDKSKCREK